MEGCQHKERHGSINGANAGINGGRKGTLIWRTERLPILRQYRTAPGLVPQQLVGQYRTARSRRVGAWRGIAGVRGVSTGQRVGGSGQRVGGSGQRVGGA
eukprot:463555-Rhodomonas_salina.2